MCVCCVGSCSTPRVLPGCWFFWPDCHLGPQELSSPGPSLGLLELLPSSRVPQSLSHFSDHPVLWLYALPRCVDCLSASSFCVPIFVNKLFPPCSFCIWVLPCQTLTHFSFFSLFEIFAVIKPWVNAFCTFYISCLLIYNWWWVNNNLLLGSFCGKVHYSVPSLYINITFKNTLGLRFKNETICYLNHYTLSHQCGNVYFFII